MSRVAYSLAKQRFKWACVSTLFFQSMKETLETQPAEDLDQFIHMVIWSEFAWHIISEGTLSKTWPIQQQSIWLGPKIPQLLRIFWIYLSVWFTGLWKEMASHFTQFKVIQTKSGYFLFKWVQKNGWLNFMRQEMPLKWPTELASC